MNPLAELAARLHDAGPWAPALFIAAYVVGSLAFIPGAVLTLIAGAVFGLSRGIPIVFTGAVLGSSAAFAVARTVARDRVGRWLARDRRAAAISSAVAERGLLIVLLLRLSPVFPYNVVNYALGASTIRYRDFLVGSVGMLPGTLLYTYYGKVVGDVTALATGTAPPRGVGYYVLLGVGLLATLLLTIVVTRVAKTALGRPLDR
jgi:uncharacterized membrane protein YdjX (TVP38/TMEM64 family)